MIRPELQAAGARWAEPIAAVLVTLAGLWAVGAPGLRWGWLSVVLAVAVLLAGLVWFREAVRRVLRRRRGEGRMFVEERRVLSTGALGNVQVDLDDVDRLDLVAGGEGGVTLMLHAPGGPPAAVPLGGEGEEALLDALSGLPGLNRDALRREAGRVRRDGGARIAAWRRG